MSGVPSLIIGRKGEVTPALRCFRTNLPPPAFLQHSQLPPHPRLGEVRNPESFVLYIGHHEKAGAPR